MEGNGWSMRLERGPGAVRAARDFVAGARRRSGWPGSPQDAALACTELVTNALVHTDSAAVSLRAWRRGERFGIEVTDDDPRFRPRAGPVDPCATSGRGLLLIDAVARRWGVRPEGRGKTVWVDLAAENEPATTPSPVAAPA